MPDSIPEDGLPTPRGAEIKEKDAVLHRVLRRCFTDDGVVSSSNFVPSRGDQGLMSTDQAKLAPAASTFKAAVDGALDPVAISALTVGHVHDAALTAYADPETSPPNPAHAVVNFQSVSAPTASALKRENTRRAKLLRKSASQAGCVYPQGAQLTWPHD